MPHTKHPNVMKKKRKDATDYICDEICNESRGVPPETLKQLIILAIEIAREGREGKKIGTLFTLGDVEAVLDKSKCLILDPLLGHPDEDKSIFDYNMRETVKELAALDGAFVVRDDGVVVSACRYLDASSHGIALPLGLGTRHMAAASMTRETGAVGVLVSESSMVRIFDEGEIISEIIPELWLLSRYSVHLQGPYREYTDKDMTVISRTK
jgi:DNA integrity scanning protein DisA with diadenylate cyclase activity